MLNLTRLHLGIAHESQFQGLGIKRFFREMLGLYPIPNCFANGYLANGGKRRDGNVPSNAEVDPRTKRSPSAMQEEVCQSALASRTSE